MYKKWWMYPCLMAQSMYTGAETVVRGVSARILNRMNGKQLLGYRFKTMLLPTTIAGILSSG